MAPRWLGRLATVVVTSSALFAFVACDDGYYDGYAGRGRSRGSYSCENPVRQCQTYCQDYCDSWGYCTPYCQDQCWTDCDSTSSNGVIDASTTIVDATAPVTDAAAPSGESGGALCAPCASNTDCLEDALCIFYGVPSSRDGGDPDAAAPQSTSASFCGAACSSAVACPTGFTCATLGARQQCVPSSGRCN